MDDAANNDGTLFPLASGTDSTQQARQTLKTFAFGQCSF